MQYEITAKDPTTVDMSPKTKALEILQNVRTILSTQKGTIRSIVNLAWTALSLICR